MNRRIDWMEMIVNALPDYSDGSIWSESGETKNRRMERFN